MAPSSYAQEYLDSLAKKGKTVTDFGAVSGSQALALEEPEPVSVPAVAPSRSAVRKQERQLRRSLEAVPQAGQRLMTAPALVRSAFLVFFIGVLLIMSVWMGAQATAIQYRINTLTKQNIQLEDEITNLQIQIEGAVSFETIEKYAIGDLKMAYPKQSQCVYIEEGMEVTPGLANTIRSKVYGN